MQKQIGIQEYIAKFGKKDEAQSGWDNTICSVMHVKGANSSGDKDEILDIS